MKIRESSLENSKVLNSKYFDIKEKVAGYLKEQFDYSPQKTLLFKEMGKRKIYAFKMCSLGNEAVIEDGVYKFTKIAPNDRIENRTLPKTFKIQHYGTYFARIERDGLRLSIEGSYIVGPNAGKGVIEINKKTASLWMKGEDIPLEIDITGYVILKNGNYYLGCGRSNGKFIRNFIPKGRRI